MVTFADVLQAIKGTDFPATREELIAHAEEKKDSPVWTVEDLAPVLEFLRALPENTTYRNPAKIAEVLGATQQALGEGRNVPSESKPVNTHRSQDRPLGTGGLEPARDVADRARELHERGGE